MKKTVKYNSVKEVRIIILDFIFLSILTVGFFWKPLFANKDLLEFLRCGFIFYYFLSYLFAYLFMRFVIKVSRFSSLVSTVIFTFGGALLGIVLLNPAIARGGWLLGVYIGILPLFLLRLAFTEKYKRLSRIFLIIFLLSITGFLKIEIFKYLNILTNFSLAALAGLGVENLLSPLKGKSNILYESYVKKLKNLLFFASFVVMPIIFGLLLRFYGSGLENTSIKISGNICLIYIFFVLTVLIFKVRSIKNNVYLPSLIIILIILDIFSYWGMFR